MYSGTGTPRGKPRRQSSAISNPGIHLSTTCRAIGGDTQPGDLWLPAGKGGKHLIRQTRQLLKRFHEGCLLKLVRNPQKHPSGSAAAGYMAGRRRAAGHNPAQRQPLAFILPVSENEARSCAAMQGPAKLFDPDPHRCGIAPRRKRLR